MVEEDVPAPFVDEKAWLSNVMGGSGSGPWEKRFLLFKWLDFVKIVPQRVAYLPEGWKNLVINLGLRKSALMMETSPH